MVSVMIFKQIQQLKSKGLNINQVARRLEISYQTVKKYWNSNEEGFKEIQKDQSIKRRKSRCDRYRQEVIDLLKDYPEFTSAQIFDRLQEKYKNTLDFTEETLRNYVARIRQEIDLPKRKSQRNYQIVIEAEPGSQAQIDFGEIQVRRAENKKKRIKLYCIVVVLSYSRYKYCFWQDHPFNSREVAEAHQKAFLYYGGIPKELVYDQDSRIVASENYGEIVFVETFQSYLNQLPVKTYICRPADPESKGKVENAVGYLKNNFARGRLFKDIQTWNRECLDWLNRRGNGKAHQTIKEIPAERFEIERSYLQPVPQRVKIPDVIINYRLNKDNTLTYHSNRYEVPYGSYNNCPDVKVREHGEKIAVYSCKNGELLAEHKVLTGSGHLAALPRPESRLDPQSYKLRKEAFELLGQTEEASLFINTVIKNFPRYIQEQMKLVIQTAETWSNDRILIQDTLKECIHYGNYSALSFKNTIEQLASQRQIEEYPFNKDAGYWEKLRAIYQSPDFKEGTLLQRYKELERIQKENDKQKE